MLTDDGPRVLEYNCRFGDPETEVVIPRLACDLADLLEATATDHLSDVKVVTSDDAAVTVVLASGGYPGPYTTGRAIAGLDEAAMVPGATVFHAGTAERDGRVVTAGGRVLAITGTAATIAEARAIAYEAAARISFEGKTLTARCRGARRGGGAAVTDETPRAGVLAASPSELGTMRQAGLILEKFGVEHEVRIMSSSRNPDLVDEYARTAFDRGLKVIICSTGMSGHLAAAVAARTVLPVIGVPIATSPQMLGYEALAITAQMPTGVPVATVGVDAAVNAAVLAAQIVGIGDPDVQAALWRFKDDLAEGLKL